MDGWMNGARCQRSDWITWSSFDIVHDGWLAYEKSEERQKDGMDREK